jgi:hypothetical protein
VTIATGSWSGTEDGLYSSHAYAIVGYNSATDTFTLYNPWGSNQPGQLSWSQLQATCTEMTVAGTSGTTPILGIAGKAASVGTALANGLPVSAAGSPGDATVATNAAFSQIQAVPASDAGQQVSPTASGSREWRGLAGSSAWHSREYRVTAAPHSVLSPTLVDAALATGDLLS